MAQSREQRFPCQLRHRQATTDRLSRSPASSVQTMSRKGSVCVVRLRDMRDDPKCTAKQKSEAEGTRCKAPVCGWVVCTQAPWIQTSKHRPFLHNCTTVGVFHLSSWRWRSRAASSVGWRLGDVRGYISWNATIGSAQNLNPISSQVRMTRSLLSPDSLQIRRIGSYMYFTMGTSRSEDQRERPGPWKNRQANQISISYKEALKRQERNA